MFEHPVNVIISAIKELELSLKTNQRTQHLSKENVNEMQETISYLSKRIITVYEKDTQKK